MSKNVVTLTRGHSNVIESGTIR